MRRIELIGTSGVGKTTLYNKFGRVQSGRRNFITLKEAYKKAALHCDISIKQLKLFCFQQVLKSGLIKRKERGLGKVILVGHENSKRNKRSRYQRIHVSFDIQHQESRKDPNPFVVKKRILGFLGKVDNHLLLEQLFPGDEIILVDEGMIHYHTGITDYALQTYSTDQLMNDPVFNPDGIIHCVQSEEVVFNQALKRKEGGVLTIGHGHLSNIELKTHVNKKILKNKIKAERFKNLGIPVLEVNTGEDFEGIMDRTINFASSLNR